MMGLWKVQREPCWLEMAAFLSKRELSELCHSYGSTYGTVASATLGTSRDSLAGLHVLDVPVSAWEGAIHFLSVLHLPTLACIVASRGHEQVLESESK